jgi:hypothetical protein
MKLTPGVHEGGKDEMEKNRDRAAEPAHLGPVGHRQSIAQHHTERVNYAAGEYESATAGSRLGEKPSTAPDVGCNFDHHGQHNQLDAEKNRIAYHTGEPVFCRVAASQAKKMPPELGPRREGQRAESESRARGRA